MDIETAFSDFLDRREYDQAANALFSMVRISFLAGWLAAKGQPPEPQKIVELRREIPEAIKLRLNMETELEKYEPK